MTKILMTSVRDDEQAAIQDYATRNQVEIVTSPQPIGEVLELTADVDGVVIQQRDPLGKEVYPTLKANGSSKSPPERPATTWWTSRLPSKMA